jgi:hypothetical protein
LWTVPTGWAQEVTQNQHLFPNTTKGYLAITDVQALSDHWDATQLGELMNDPVMEPFAKDIRRQFQERLSRLRDRLGLSLDDLKGVPGGGLSVALIQPAKGKAALAILIDVTGHLPQAEAMLEKVAKNFEKKDAKQTSREADGTKVIVFDVPKTEMEPASQVAYFLSGNLLGGADDPDVIEGILRRKIGQGPKGETLADVPAFRAVMARCRAHLAEPIPQVRWFIEPLGYIEAMRAATPPDKLRQSKTVLEIVKNQGFTAVQGVGGFVDFKVAGYELLHRTAIYAPPPYKPAPPPYKDRVSMDMLSFPNSRDFAPLPWIPNDIATCTTFHWDILKAFDNFGPMFDEMVGGSDFLFAVKPEFLKDMEAQVLSKPLREKFAAEKSALSEHATVMTQEAGCLWRILDDDNTYIVKKTPEGLKVYIANAGVWDDVLKSLKEDPNGPQIDLRKELIAHLGHRITVISDYQLPITTTSERLLFAIKTLDEKAVAEGIRKTLEGDPTIKKRVFEGHVIWETVEEEGPEAPAGPPLIDIPSLHPKKEPPPEEDNAAGAMDDDDDGEKPLLPHASVTVAHGHLLVASHYDFLTRILHKTKNPDPLSQASDYKDIDEAMKKLGADENCVRSFSRTDEEYRPTYELIRKGKMPESEAMLGRLLNALFGPHKKGVVRKQRLDGRELPDYQIVRRYLGPAGLFATSEKDGWFVVGFTLKK